MRVLAITRKPYSASFEQRIAAYKELLEEFGVELTIRQFPTDVREQGIMLRKAAGFEIVWWHRHLLTHYMRKQLRRNAHRIVFDFDDPLYYSTSKSGKSLARRWRFRGMLRIADGAMAGSDYLRKLALPYNDKVHVVPMAIGRDEVPKPSRNLKDPIQLLWVGSESTQKYLELIRPTLEHLGNQSNRFRLKLVGHYSMKFGKLPVDYVRWSPDEQNLALAKSDIGLCPMPDTPWTRGKCPYKVIQYMATAMPWVGSGVGENLYVAGDAADPRKRGLCATDDNAWEQAIMQLADDPDLRIRLGVQGVWYIQAHHERHAVARQIAEIMQQISREPAKPSGIRRLFSLVSGLRTNRHPKGQSTG